MLRRMGPANTSAPRSRFASILPASTVLVLAACGPAPGAGGPGEARAPEAHPAETIYIVLGEQPETRTDAWVPEEALGNNPFNRTRTWIGDYDCPQGNTEFTFRIIQVRDDKIKAIFDFNHVESGATGKYLMTGRYDEQTRTATFRPGAWIKQPPNYVTVGMKGDVAVDGSLFAGRIDHPLCGAFRLRPAN
jgi:hypothetical protein